MPYRLTDSLTHSQTLKDSATQYKSGALVTHRLYLYFTILYKHKIKTAMSSQLSLLLSMIYEHPSKWNAIRPKQPIITRLVLKSLQKTNKVMSSGQSNLLSLNSLQKPLWCHQAAKKSEAVAVNCSGGSGRTGAVISSHYHLSFHFGDRCNFFSIIFLFHVGDSPKRPFWAFGHTRSRCWNKSLMWHCHAK